MYECKHSSAFNARMEEEVKEKMRHEYCMNSLKSFTIRCHSFLLLGCRLIPDYRFTAKRLGISPETQKGKSTLYIDTVTRENVEVVREAIDAAESDGLQTRCGTMHKLDVLIIATGFNSTRFVSPIKLIGQTGRINVSSHGACQVSMF